MLQLASQTLEAMGEEGLDREISPAASASLLLPSTAAIAVAITD